MKILFLAANPESTSRLNLAKEAQEIQDAIDSSELSSEFELIQRWEVRPKDFRRALLRYQPDIVHFSGHGSGKTGLIISNDAGESKKVSGDALAGLFAAFPMVKCVLLNACYAEVQARTIVAHVNYVIGMKDTIYDKAATAFSIGFYDSLGYGRNFEEAFALGSNAILWEYDNNTGQKRDEPRKLIPVKSVLSKLPEHLKPILLCKDSLIIPETKTISISPEESKPDGKQIFLERVQKYVTERRLTPIAKFQLNNFAKEQGLSETETNSILDAEIGKIEQAKQNYQKLLEATIAAGLNPLDPANQQDLKSLQQDLKLTDEEVVEISNLVLSDAETNKLEIEKTIDIKEPEKQKALETESRIQKFSFEVITVDDTGKENSRTTRETEFYREYLGNNIWLDMVRIPSGEFMMGSPNRKGYSNKKPQHKVTVPSFWMGKYPITQAQWQEIMGNNPSSFKDNQNNPVENVSWEDAKEFCQQLVQKTGNKYRLPSEAEWEYACRSVISGDMTVEEWNKQYNQPFHFGETISSDLANYSGNYTYRKGVKGEYRVQTTSVGYFKVANNFGLSDMHGNVWEWCEDDWHENYDGAPNNGNAWRSEPSINKVVRGGSWFNNPSYCRSAFRYYNSRVNRKDDVGFRVVCVAPRAT